MLSETWRLAFQSKLENILGSRNVYFQPPASIHMNYPCIVYHYEDDDSVHASNSKYLSRDKYSLTLITKNPNPIGTLYGLSALPYSSFDRHYQEDNLHHFSFTTYVTSLYGGI